MTIHDLFWETKHDETTIEIELKVGNSIILNKYLKIIFSQYLIIALPLHEVSKRLVAPAFQASSLLL